MFRRKRDVEDFSAELESHLQLETDGLREQGLSEQEARAAAHRAFGNPTLVREHFYESGRSLWWDNLRDDLRFAWRMMRNNSGVSAIVVLTLAIGIGANTAIFSVVYAVLLRPLPYPHANRLVWLSERAPGLPLLFVSLANLDDWRSMNSVFEGMEAFRTVDVTLDGYGEPRRLAMRQVTVGLFPMLGVQPVLGRLFTAKDDKPDSKPVVLLSDSMWTREFGRSPNVLYRNLLIDGESYMIIGVVPTSRCHMSWRQIDVFTSLGRMQKLIGGPEHRDAHSRVWAYARMKPGVTIGEARRDMSAVARRLENLYPATNAGTGVNVDLLHESVVQGARQPLLLLMGAVVLVLLIACTNVANLLMSLAVVRRREIAVRSALGAGPNRLARQQLCESILLALIGGTVGLVAARCATAAIAHLASASVPSVEDVSIDRPVLLFTLGVSLLTGFVFGAFPALMAYLTDPNEVLKNAGNTSGAGLTCREVRSFLAAGELALSLVLLVATGLTFKSLISLVDADLGFQTKGVLTASLSLTTSKYNNDLPNRRKFAEEIVARLAGLPGVKAVGVKDPLLGNAQVDFRVEGRPQPEPGYEPYVEISRVTPGALEALRTQLRRGRYFNSEDTENAQPVCVIDSTLADQYWPDGSALGKRIDFDVHPSLGKPRGWWTIVGIIDHIQNYGASTPSLPEVFAPYAQQPGREASLVIRSDEDPSTLEPMVREVLHSIDPGLPLYNVRPLAQLTDEYVAPQRLSTILLGVLAAIALLLAAVGTYSVMAYTIAGRTREIGVRRALGARPVDVLRLVMSQGICVALAGLTVGALGSLALGRILGPMLFGVKASDPVIFAGGGGLLLAVAFVACEIPARKAMRLDPIAAVRHE